MRSIILTWGTLSLCLLLVACSDDSPTTDDVEMDGGSPDAAMADDAGMERDAGPGDAGPGDAGPGDGGPTDAGCPDRDSDGTCDADDGCPDEPTLTEPTACGCDPDAVPGTFVDSTRTAGVSATRKPLLGDFDDDGDLDVFVVNAFRPDEVWFNDGTGTFTDSGQTFESFVSSAGAIRDFDQDGDLDAMITTTARTSPDSRLYLNDGAGVFSDSGVRIASGNFVALAAGDFDGDTYPDFAVTNFSSSARTSAYVNDGAGTGFTPTDFGSFGAWGVDVGDVDGDGDDDVVLGIDNMANQVRLSDGSGGFTSGTSFGATDSRTFSIALGDFDGDGDLDVAAGSEQSQSSLIFLNDGSGTFTDSGQTLDAGQAEFAMAYDVDLDGDLDVVFSDMRNDPNGGARIFLNDGTGTFTLGQHIGVGLASRGFGIGDVDGDGLPDIVVATEAIDVGNPIWLNTCTTP